MDPRREAADAPLEDGAPRRLAELLRALPDTELASLVKRLGIRIDPAKRIDTPSQVARALVGIPEVREPGRLPPASRELLHRIAEAGGRLVLPVLPAGLDGLAARGLVFAHRIEDGIELVLPIAFLLQLRTWEGEDPRGARALLAQAPLETLGAIASHYLGRPANPPIPLSVEAAWDVLGDAAQLADEIARLPALERRLLDSIDAVGGEVDTQELLDLEREPLRLRSATGVSASRRGAGFALERRGFLIPILPNRHVVPTEVARLVGADRRRLRAAHREEVRSFVVEEDHAPRRARFAGDPGALALALAFVVREPGNEVRGGVGTPRSLVTKLGQRLGREPEMVALLSALSRAVGLWEPTASSRATPPGSLTVNELVPLLFAAWRRGGAWDEARIEPEVLRVAPDARDTGPTGALREMVLDALRELAEGRWAPWSSLRAYLSADERVAGIDRALRRWSDRAGLEAPDPVEVMRRIALESLFALGVIDLGNLDDLDATGRVDTADPAARIALRLTPRGRALLAGVEPGCDPAPSRFIDSHALRVAPSAHVGSVLALSSFAELGRIDDRVDLLLTTPSLARALSVGVDSDAMRTRIEAVAELPDTISRMLAQASVVVGRASLVQAAAFLWIEDPEIRELLRTRRPACELFVDPSPPGGLLVAAGVELERLVRRCRALGVEVEADAEVLRARIVTPPPGEARASTRSRPRAR